MSILYLLLIFPVGYIFGSIRSYSNTKKIIKPKDYLKSVVRGFINLFKSILGQPIISVSTWIVDGNYYRLSKSQIREAIKEVHELMRSTGWSSYDYVSEVKDCDDFADKMRVELKEYILSRYRNDIGNRSIGVGIIGYLIDGDRKRAHASLKVLINDGTVEYYNVYPESIWENPMKLSQKELDSIFNVYM